MDIEFEKKLIEEAVFSFLEKEKSEGRQAAYLHFRSRWNALYSLAEEDVREKRFSELALETFTACKLDEKLLNLMDRFPLIRQKVRKLLVRHAHRKNEEGSDLFVKEQIYTVVVRAGLERFLDGVKWKEWLAENLIRIEDVLDPAFGYQPADYSQAKLGPRAVVVEERYRMLWLEEARRRAKDPAAPRLTHAQLIEAAQSAAAPRAARRDCPLCRFPTRDWACRPAGTVVAAVSEDFPRWKEADGLCRRCSEIYEAKIRGFYVPFPGIA